MPRRQNTRGKVAGREPLAMPSSEANRYPPTTQPITR